jgi:hypothetical protein
MSVNPDSVTNQGEFAGHVKPSEPLMEGGVSRIFFQLRLFKAVRSMDRLTTQLSSTATHCPRSCPQLPNTQLTAPSTNLESLSATTPPLNSTLRPSPPVPPLHPRPSPPTPTSTTRRCTTKPPTPSKAPPQRTYTPVSATQVKARPHLSCVTEQRLPVSRAVAAT